MPNIQSTFKIKFDQKYHEKRAYIDDNDINPKTKKLGIRVYENNTFLQKFVLLLKQLFARTVSLTDGSGQELIVSKESLRNWCQAHGENYQPGDANLSVIDKVFKKSILDSKVEPKIVPETGSYAQIKGDQAKTSAAEVKKGLKEQTPKDTNTSAPKTSEKTAVKEKEDIEKERDKIPPPKTQKASANEIAAFNRLKPGIVKARQELIEEQKKNLQKYNKDIKSSADRLKVMRGNIEKMHFPLSTTKEELAKITSYKGLLSQGVSITSVLNTARGWAVHKYNTQSLIEALELSLKNIESLDPENASSLSELTKIPKPPELTTEEIVNRFNKEYEDLKKDFDYLEWQTANLRIRVKWIEDGHAEKFLSRLRDPKPVVMEGEEDFISGFYSLVNSFDETDVEVKNFLLKNAKDPLQQEDLADAWGDLLAIFWLNTNTFDREAYKELSPLAKEAATRTISTREPAWVLKDEPEKAVENKTSETPQLSEEEIAFNEEKNKKIKSRQAFIEKKKEDLENFKNDLKMKTEEFKEIRKRHEAISLPISTPNEELAEVTSFETLEKELKFIQKFSKEMKDLSEKKHIAENYIQLLEDSVKDIEQLTSKSSPGLKDFARPPTVPELLPYKLDELFKKEEKEFITDYTFSNTRIQNLKSKIEFIESPQAKTLMNKLRNTKDEELGELAADIYNVIDFLDESDIEIENFLLEKAKDKNQSKELAEQWGDLLAKFWLNTNKFDRESYMQLPENAQAEAERTIYTENPEWLG